MKDRLKKMAELRVVVVGDVILDHYIWGDASRISPEAPVPVVRVERESYAAGGAANVALNARELGAHTELCGAVDDDDAGRTLCRLLDEKDVVFEASRFSIHTPTILKTRVLAQHQQLCRIDREPMLGPGDVPDSVKPAVLSRLDDADAVILTDYAKGFLNADLVAAIIRQCHQSGKLVSLDPKPRRALHFHGLDLITPNRREALELAGIRLDPHEPFPAEEVCQTIWERYGPKVLVITMSEEGMLISREGKLTAKAPTVAREVFDVSGAGDTVIAALSLALAAGADVEEAAHLANVAAGVVVGKLGTATVSPEEILRAVDEL